MSERKDMTIKWQILSMAMICAGNATIAIIWPPAAANGIDPVAGAAAIVGISSVEWWMVRLCVALNLYTDRLKKQTKVLEERLAELRGAPDV
jgi:hypothetical protein